MKRKESITVLASLFVLSMQSLFAQDVDFEWVQQLGDSHTSVTYSLTTDSYGNIYTIGTFYGLLEFDSESGIDTLVSIGASDIFIQKSDTDGNFIWVKQMEGTGEGTSEGRGFSIAVDEFGNVYSTGVFFGEVDFNPGVETEIFVSGGARDIFVQKLDFEGNLLWAKQMGSSSSDAGTSIAVDFSGNVYSTGSFRGTVDFNPGSDELYLSSSGAEDIFVQKLDTNGNLLWVKRFGGAARDESHSITVDTVGNVYTTGFFHGTLGVGMANFTSAGVADVFIQKLDTDGGFIWAKQMGGDGYDQGVSLTVDGFGNIYSTGAFNGTVDFDPGEGIANLSSAGEDDIDIFVQKLDSNGDFLWVKQIGGDSFDSSKSLTVDMNGNVFVTGAFRGTADFNIEGEPMEFTSAGNDDIFIQKIDTDGNFIWAKQIGGGYHDRANSIITDESDNIYITGIFGETVDFDPEQETVNITSAGYFDIFILKLSKSSTVSLSELDFKINFLVYPNPSNDKFHIEFEKLIVDADLIITDIHGRLISSTKIKNTHKSILEINEAPGIYLLTVKTEEGQQLIKMVKK